MINGSGFIKLTAISIIGLILSLESFLQEPAHTQELKPRVVVVRNKKLKDENGNFNQLELKKTVNEALKIIFRDETGATGLGKIIAPDAKVGLKIQCYLGEKDNVTHPELVDALLYFLRQNKVADNNIIVWDDDLGHLEKAGYRFNNSDKGVQYLATQHKKPRDQGIKQIIGFDDTEITAGKVKTRVSNILSKLTAITINMPVLKTHKFKDDIGISCAMLNMYGVIEVTDKNVDALYANNGDPAVAEVYSIPQIKNKTKLIICDAITPLYNGGPMDDKRHHTDYNGIIVGFDPVAVDTVGQDILQKIRDAKFGKNATKLKTKYIETAGNDKYKLGTDDMKWIEVIEKTLD